MGASSRVDFHDVLCVCSHGSQSAVCFGGPAHFSDPALTRESGGWKMGLKTAYVKYSPVNLFSEEGKFNWFIFKKQMLCLSIKFAVFIKFLHCGDLQYDFFLTTILSVKQEEK